MRPDDVEIAQDERAGIVPHSAARQEEPSPLSRASLGPTTVDLLADLDALPTALVILDSNGTIVRVNRRACDILRRRVEDLPGREIGSVLVTSELIEAALQAKDNRHRCEVISGDGTPIVVGYHVTVMHVGDEQYLAISLQDITRFEALERERDHLLRQAAVGHVLPSMLHELKNPLAAVEATIEVMLEEELEEARVRTDLSAVLGEVQRMLLTLDGLGAFARPLRGLQPASVHKAARDALRILNVYALRKSLHVVAEIDDLPMLAFDTSVVRAIVFNLVMNAIQACRSGDEIRLKVRLEEEGRLLLLVVEDTGPGMTRDVIGRATDLFFTTRPSGSGIGLALCLRAAEGAEGTLEIESRIQRGTKVTLRVPCEVGPEDSGISRR